MRLMDFGGQEGVVILADFYGQLLRRVEIHDQLETPLPQNPPRTYYRFNGEFFALCEGEGALFYRDYPAVLNFESLDPFELEAYLLHNKLSTDPQQRTLVSQFCKVYDRNIQKGFLYLNPPHFQEIERALFHGQFFN